jgi:hypothetical protein
MTVGQATGENLADQRRRRQRLGLAAYAGDRCRALGDDPAILGHRFIDGAGEVPAHTPYEPPRRVFIALCLVHASPLAIRDRHAAGWCATLRRASGRLDHVGAEQFDQRLL